MRTTSSVLIGLFFLSFAEASDFSGVWTGEVSGLATRNSERIPFTCSGRLEIKHTENTFQVKLVSYTNCFDSEDNVMDWGWATLYGKLEIENGHLLLEGKRIGRISQNSFQFNIPGKYYEPLRGSLNTNGTLNFSDLIHYYTVPGGPTKIRIKGNGLVRQVEEED